MKALEIPKTETLATGDGLLSNIPAVLAFLLTRLLQHEEALLHAEWRGAESEVSWYVRPRGTSGEADDVAVAALPAGIFSSLVSRVALSFDIDYTHGGSGRGILTQGASRHDCRIFLSRCRQTGYWIRIYAVAIQPSVSQGADGAPR